MTEHATACIAFGSNLGDRHATLAGAYAALSSHPAIEPLQRSRLFETAPVGGPGGQGRFLNTVLKVRTSLSPQDLLSHCMTVERQFKRERVIRWDARTLDLDLIDFDGRVEPDANVQATWRALPPDRQAKDAPDRMILPHPRLQDRGFVLLPMQEIAPDWRDPVSGLDVTALIDRLPSEAKADIYPVSDTGELLSKSAGFGR